IPPLVWGEGARALFRLSFEYGFLLLLLVAIAGTRLRAPVRWLGVALYSALLLFLFYHYAFKAFFLREPAVVEDWRVTINLVHFLSEMTSARWVIFTWGCVIGSLALIVLIERMFAALQRRVRPSLKQLAIAATAWVVLGGVSVLLDGPIRVAGAKIADN